MKLNLEECCLSVIPSEKKNKYGNWEVRVHCGAALDKSVEKFKHSCDMVYQFGCSSSDRAEELALCKFIQDRFKD